MSHYLLQFFEYGFMTEERQEIAKPFHELAHRIVKEIPNNPERTVALRSLLEAQEGVLRAMSFQDIT